MERAMGTGKWFMFSAYDLLLVRCQFQIPILNRQDITLAVTVHVDIGNRLLSGLK